MNQNIAGLNPATARSLAVHILTRVEEEKAYANLLLQSNSGLLAQVRDRQLLTILVNGTLKHRLTLDYALRRHLRKPMSSLPVPVRGILRSGAFQLLFLEKIPAAAAIYESVELAKALEPKFTGLINGVLRKVQECGWQLNWPDALREPVRYLSVRYSHPEWMVRRWWKRWGFAETEDLCRINNKPALTWIRVNTLKTTAEELQKVLEQEGLTVQKGGRLPDSLLISGFGALERLASFRAGLFAVQDESSQLVAHVLAPEPGQMVLDACAAPGGKTTHLAEFMQNQGEILAFDIHEHKLRLIEELAGRLGVRNIRICLGDARELKGVAAGSRDKVLVDAPCSGLGVLRRKSDLRWQKQEEELAGFPPLQLAILERAAEVVKPGGELLYSTCTLEPEENFEVVKAFRLAYPEFTPVDLTESLPFALSEERERQQAVKGMLQLLPQRQGTDGFFVAKFRKGEV